MTKVDFIANIAKETGLTVKDAKNAYDAIFGQIKTVLKKEGAYAVPGFGTFKVSRSKARKGINPLTKKPIDIAASNRVSFKQGSALKEELNK